jgi:uracil-DNA glycosylase
MMPASVSPSVRSARNKLDALLAEIRACRLCDLPHEPRPVIVASARSKILIIGQAPGRRVHESGAPWTDASGDRLRAWMGLDWDRFYDPDNVAVAAMAFCYPGTVKGADLPPRRECAARWRPRLMPLLKHARLTLLVGSYAHKYHLGDKARASLHDTVLHWREHAPDTFVLPHPSWRNTAWLKRNPWFERDLVPALQARVRAILNAGD